MISIEISWSGNEAGTCNRITEEVEEAGGQPESDPIAKNKGKIRKLLLVYNRRNSCKTGSRGF